MVRSVVLYCQTSVMLTCNLFRYRVRDVEDLLQYFRNTFYCVVCATVVRSSTLGHSKCRFSLYILYS